MTDKMKLLKRTKLFVLDMDGTFYLGNQILPGAADFLKSSDQGAEFDVKEHQDPADYVQNSQAQAANLA